MVTVGIDEVGRGSWAGPVVAAAVVLNKKIPGLKDSKLLSRSQRELLNNQILEASLSVGVGFSSVGEINKLGLSESIRLAMSRSLQQINVEYQQIIIDGNFNFLKNNPKSQAVIKADLGIPCVSAASIVAKVERDRLMSELAKKYPRYGFERHVGYGTEFHRQMISLHGICKIHRLNFKPILTLTS